MIHGKLPCERIVAEVLPTIRARLASIIMHEHGLSQTKTAELIGVTQAAISQYASKRRANEELLHDHPPVADEIAALAVRLVEGISESEMEASVCGICKMFRKSVLEGKDLDSTCR